MHATPTHGALRTNGVPNARANTGRPGTGPSPAAPKTIEPSGPIGNTRASHCIHPDLARGGNSPHQLNRVMSESGSKRGSASRINSAAAYSDANRNCSAMAAGSHGDHAPVSVKLGRNCGRSRTDDCKNGRQSENPLKIGDHGVLRCRINFEGLRIGGASEYESSGKLQNRGPAIGLDKTEVR